MLAVIVLLKTADLAMDIGLGLPASHLAQEWTLLLLSFGGFIYLVVEMRQRTLRYTALADTLSLSEERLGALTDEMREARRRHGQAVQQQFHAWGLTTSEQEVALMLLKGLSLREIATLRDTREKTVRQQASTIYGKCGLEGRHALAAWFLEDFLFEQEASSCKPPQE